MTDYISKHTGLAVDESVDAVTLLKTMPLPQFMDGQHTNQVKIIRGSAATVETILFENAVLSVDTYAFTLAEEVNLPATFHIELKDGGDSATGAMVGNLVVNVVGQEAYGGGRFGGGLTDYYFKGVLQPDKMELQLALMRPIYKDGATHNLQLTVNENGLPHNVVSSEWVEEALEKGKAHSHPEPPPPSPPPPPPVEYEPEVVSVSISKTTPTRGDCATAFKLTIDPDWTRNKTFFVEDSKGNHRIFAIIYVAGRATDEASSGVFAIEKMLLRL